MSKYPDQIDDSISIPDPVSGTNSDVIDALKSAVLAIENALGMVPGNAYTSARVRLDILESRIGFLTGGSSFIGSGDLLGNALEQTVVGLQGRSLSSDDPSDGYAIIWDNTNSIWKPGQVSGEGSFTADGDLSGSSTSQTVVGIQSRTVASTLPTNGQALVWNDSLSQWEPQTVAGISFTIDSFAKTAPNSSTILYRRGDTLTGLTASATYSVEPDSASITTSYGGSTAGGDIDLCSWSTSSPFTSSSASGSVKRSGSDLGANPTATFELSATKTVNKTSSITITWGSDVYWGVGVAGLSTEAQIEALTGTALATGRTRTFSVTPSNQKIYYAFPKGYGAATFVLNGFPAAFNAPSEVSVTNSNGVTRTYYLYESTNLLTSATALNFVVS